MSFPSPARDWWEVPLSLDVFCDIKNPAVFLFRYEGEDQPYVKKGAVLIVDKSLTPKAGDLLIATTHGEMAVTSYNALAASEESTIEGVVTRVLNVLR